MTTFRHLWMSVYVCFWKAYMILRRRPIHHTGCPGIAPCDCWPGRSHMIDCPWGIGDKAAKLWGQRYEQFGGRACTCPTAGKSRTLSHIRIEDV